MNRLSLLLIDGTQVGPFVQQQLHHLWDKWIGLGWSVRPSLLITLVIFQQGIIMFEFSPPESHSEQHGAGQFCQCDLPCSGCSDG